MNGLFDGKTVIVTGGSSGIGRACALAFAREGGKLLIADIDAKDGEETVKLIQKEGGKAIFVKTDVSKPKEVETMVNTAVETYGKLDCAFNNAGAPGLGVPMLDVTEEEWDKVIDTGLKGVWLCMKYEIPVMIKQGGGTIVNTSSVAGGRPATNHYGASKWGIEGLTQGAAMLYGKDGIRVNAVRPNNIETKFPAQRREYWRQKDPASTYATAPMGADPSVMAPAVLWLASDLSANVTGISIPIIPM